jgi:hypothetical protein
MLVEHRPQDMGNQREKGTTGQQEDRDLKMTTVESGNFLCQDRFQCLLDMTLPTLKSRGVQLTPLPGVVLLEQLYN